MRKSIGSRMDSPICLADMRLPCFVEGFLPGVKVGNNVGDFSLIGAIMWTQHRAINGISILVRSKASLYRHIEFHERHGEIASHPRDLLLDGWDDGWDHRGTVGDVRDVQ